MGRVILIPKGSAAAIILMIKEGDAAGISNDIGTSLMALKLGSVCQQGVRPLGKATIFAWKVGFRPIS